MEINLKENSNLIVKDHSGNTLCSIDEATGSIKASNNEDIAAALEGLDVSVGSLDADGLITGGEIVEKMSGYGYTPPTDEDNEFNFSYVGAVKNGNKLTFVIAGTFTKVESSANNKSIGQIIIPRSIYDKLYPNSLSSLDNKAILFMSSSTSGFSKFVRAYKISATSTSGNLDCSLFGTNSDFVVGTPYEFRYEVTFLLSENLIPD